MSAALLAAAPVGTAAAQDPVRPGDLTHAMWPARWICCPASEPRASSVYHFRRHLALASPPTRFVVHVSADNRFILFVNGARIGEGPARADLDHWRYETYDIAPVLKAGDNVIAAVVWNWGSLAPLGQMSDQTGFIVQGDTLAESTVDTGPGWEVEEEKGEGFLGISPAEVPNYYAASPGEFVDGRRFDWDWRLGQGGGVWKPASPVGTGEPGRFPNGYPVGTGSGLNRWLLTVDPLPPMEYSEASAGKIVRSRGVDVSTLPATIPAHTRASLLLDRATMITGYPELTLSGGKDSLVRLTYAEALVDSKGHKGNRDQIDQRSIVGLSDAVVADGGNARAWSPLWWRSWRYLQLDVQTGDTPLVVQALGAHFSAYPFREQAAFRASDESLERIWSVGTRTARLNAHDTYMDCPYWEQLQYIGDTRIQALISYVEFGDDRLARQALAAYGASLRPDGLTQSRYPSAVPQIIPPFSLLWIGMLHDFWIYRPDDGSLADWVAHTRGVLAWYEKHRRADGLLGLMPWWNFGDWTHDFDFGVPPQDPDGGSALLSLEYLSGLRDAAELEDSVGDPALATLYRHRAASIADSLRRLCFDDKRQLLADTPAQRHFSEQTNALGVLLDVIPKEFQASVMRTVLGPRPDTSCVLSPASLYFRFYVARALDHAGLADSYLGMLEPWHRMLDLGLTTWAETEEPTRSDDHAWSAHPNFDLLTLVAGIRPASPAFRTVLIAPHPGPLTAWSARMPHPSGVIEVAGRKAGERWSFKVTLPTGVSGTFLWNGQTTSLREGPNDLHLDSRAAGPSS